MFKQQSKQPTPGFIDDVFYQLRLKKKKNLCTYKEYYSGSVFKGFKTIPIQKLQNKAKVVKSTYWKAWKNQNTKQLYFYDESCPLSEQNPNGFFAAFYQAYVNHGDLKITPDDVWMAIMLFFSKYADNNAQALRKAFVNHEGKKELVIETSTNSKYKWDQFYQKIIDSIKQNTVPGVTEKLQSSFTTTDKFFHFFSTTVIMNTFKKYFDYTRKTCVCGIQNIHMGGKLTDWQQLIKKTQNLAQFDVNGRLKYYIFNLIPVLEQFLETYKGCANLEFWNNLYHERSNPNFGTYQPKSFINGWILRFFGLAEIVNDIQTLKVESINVPLKLVDNITKITKQLNIVGGTRGISVENGRIFRPHYSFAILEQKQGWKDQTL